MENEAKTLHDASEFLNKAFFLKIADSFGWGFCVHKTQGKARQGNTRSVAFCRTVAGRQAGRQRVALYIVNSAKAVTLRTDGRWMEERLVKELEGWVQVLLFS